MNILIDFITIRWFSGAGEYQRKVFYSLKNKNTSTLFALWDSSLGISYPDLKPDVLATQDVRFIDIVGRNVCDIIDEYDIDLFFIAAGQYLNSYPGIPDVKCKVICIIHDIAGEELWDNNLSYVLTRDIKRVRNHLIKRAIGKERREANVNNIFLLSKNNDNCKIITPSEYTKFSLYYHYGFDYNNISVIYTPRRILNRNSYLDDPSLKDLLVGKKYFLLLNAGRSQKNVDKVIDVFKNYSKIDNDSYLVTVQYIGKKQFANHIPVPFLSESDLGFVLENSYSLIYASIFEGFGMPPLEAMKYGKPVLASNVTSIPEVLGEAPIYFSPFYSADILKALITLRESDYCSISARSRKRYDEVSKKQDADLDKLVEMILYS